MSMDNTDIVATYVKTLFFAKISQGPEPKIPKWSLDFVEECHYAVTLLAQAVQNQSTLQPNITLLLLIFLLRAHELVGYRI